MARRALRSLIADERGAVAATYALSLFALIAVAGIGFDYARLATMDSELQSAADQAALAAATQLDGTSSAITNAKNAARNLVANQTLLSNDGNGTSITIADAGFTFYSSYSDGSGTATTDPTKARVVRVAIDSREAFYALTPVVDAVSSGDINAAATASIYSTQCKVPPVMMCNLNANPAIFDVTSLIGKGVLLKGTGGGGSWAPGDFGFLDVGAGASDLGKLLGYGTPPDKCVDLSNPSTEPGSLSSVIDDFNTRFDIFDGGDSNNCYSGSLCPPSDNSRKDLVQAGTLTTSSTFQKKDCGIKTGVGGNGWQESAHPYRPTSATLCGPSAKCGAGTPTTNYPDAMGYPRDLMHAWPNPNMNSLRVGDGTWDINAYWQANYGTAWAGQVTTSVAGRTYPTRYEVYKWERSHGSSYRQFGTGSNKSTDFLAPVCRPGKAPGANSPDRRVLPVAVVNCTGLSGKSSVTPLGWVDMFLVEPSVSRKVGSTTYTNKGDIYVEVIGPTTQGSEGAQTQFVRRDRPYLVN